MPTSRIAASAYLRHAEGDEGRELRPGFAIEVQAPIAAERGEFVTFEVHSDRGDARSTEIVLRLFRCLEEFGEGGGKKVSISHHRPDLGVSFARIPGYADSANPVSVHRVYSPLRAMRALIGRMLLWFIAPAMDSDATVAAELADLNNQIAALNRDIDALTRQVAR